MYDVDTFLTILYVTIDDFGKNAPLPPRPGPAAALSPSEVITLAHLAPMAPVSERACLLSLRPAPPGCGLPPPAGSRSVQSPRADPPRRHRGRRLGTGLAGQPAQRRLRSPRQHGRAGAERQTTRAGAPGWTSRPGLVPSGWLVHGSQAAHRRHAGGRDHGLWPGARRTSGITSWPKHGWLSGSSQRRACESRGRSVDDCYIADTGFAGQPIQRRWVSISGAVVITQPEQRRPHRWPKRLRRWRARLREIVETVHDRRL